MALIFRTFANQVLMLRALETRILVLWAVVELMTVLTSSIRDAVWTMILRLSSASSGQG